MTDKQREVLAFIVDCWWQGWIPTFQEIADEFGWTSKNNVTRVVDRLEFYGHLERMESGRLRITERGMREMGIDFSE